jgi:hypothetical protein
LDLDRRFRARAVAVKLFFLQAVLLDGAFHAPGADLETGLAELLGDDVDRGVGIEEAVADDLSLDLVGADGIGLGLGWCPGDENVEYNSG